MTDDALAAYAGIVFPFFKNRYVLIDVSPNADDRLEVLYDALVLSAESRVVLQRREWAS